MKERHVHERKACGGRTGESLISVLSDSASTSSTLRGWVTILINRFYLRLPGGSDGKEPTCQYQRHGFVPESGRSPGERNGYPFQSILA